MCPHCSTCIDLGDFHFHSHVSRSVDTRGGLAIDPAGSLTSSWIICGSATIQGSVAGTLHCEGELHLSGRRPSACQITADSVVIDKNADVSVLFPLHANRFLVKGHFKGIVECEGTVHVAKRGRLEADVRAKSLVVEKGGVFLGSCQINKCPHAPSAPAPALLPCRRRYRLPSLFPVRPLPDANPLRAHGTN